MKQPALFFVIMLFPLILLGSFGIVVSKLAEEQTKEIKIGVVDLDETFETKTLIDQLQKEEELAEAVDLIHMSNDEAETYLHNNEISAMVIIPDGFTYDLRHGENTPIQVTTNQSQPLQANMVRLLLDSGAHYISAAQSAINTVYHLYIKDLEDSEEQGDLLQSLIIRYTLFALDRNKLFSTDETYTGTTIGWENHFIIAVILISTLCSAILFQFFTYRKAARSIDDRLKSLDCRNWTMFTSQYLSYALFIFVNLILLSGTIRIVLKAEWLLFISTIITWVFTSLFLAAIMSFLDWYFGSPGSRISIGFFLFTILLVISGVIIPSIYLPGWMDSVIEISPIYSLYLSLENIILAAGIHWTNYIHLFVATLILVILVLLRTFVKEGKDGYLSISSK
jgi:ABC-2 type transport system permease protein